MHLQPIQAGTQNDVNMEGAVGVKMRMLIGRDQGATNFHMRHFELAPNGHTPHHAHDYEHEIVFLKGAGVVKTPQGDRSFKAGEIAFVPAMEKHQFINTSPGPCEFICLIPAPEECAK